MEWSVVDSRVLYDRYKQINISVFMHISTWKMYLHIYADNTFLNTPANFLYDYITGITAAVDTLKKEFPKK